MVSKKCTENISQVTKKRISECHKPFGFGIGVLVKMTLVGVQMMSTGIQVQGRDIETETKAIESNMYGGRNKGKNV
ncbi:hypothetical protein Nepgr_019561 [Nepenthes gracilis]|uniref:Uncharacterized protein n=1 Tax=Nepenthes gracilis TaxID=150966 RepID=A0AAD3STS8_NEPGR|nr:hypothetical protein Nepgr_019561 [Nepenthes gracilis]